jgi:exopolysaccharide biosynthesis polyprenyl glycosylphosphotransferase
MTQHTGELAPSWTYDSAVHTRDAETAEGPSTRRSRYALRTAREAFSVWLPQYRRTAALIDALVALVAAIGSLALGARLGLEPFSPAQLGITALAAPALWTGALLHAGAYERRNLGVGTVEYGAMPRAAIRLLAVMAIAMTLAQDLLPTSSRLLVIVAVPLTLVGSLVLRYSHRQRLHRARINHGTAMQRAVIIGCHEAVADLVEDMRRDPTHGLLPVAVCTSTPSEPIPDLLMESGPDDSLSTIDATGADVVVVAHPSELTPPELRRLSWALEERGVELMVSPGIMEVAGPRLSIRPSASLSLVHVESPAAVGGALAGKVVFDRLMSTLLALVTLPLMIAIAIAIKLESPGPVLFRQTRVGTRGESFRMIKFRSMVTDAEARLSEVRQQADDGNGVLFKRRDDPRVTRVGRVLRRYSLDELPQIWNVVLGDMSLVGPRPPLQSEVATYQADAIRRLRVRPGLTGLWQVSGRSDLSWDESLRLDLRYVDNWSMMLDLQILWRTARAVLKGEGAY